jgi:hypothetical protein
VSISSSPFYFAPKKTMDSTSRGEENPARGSAIAPVVVVPEDGHKVTLALLHLLRKLLTIQKL